MYMYPNTYVLCTCTLIHMYYVHLSDTYVISKYSELKDIYMYMYVSFLVLFPINLPAVLVMQTVNLLHNSNNN